MEEDSAPTSPHCNIVNPLFDTAPPAEPPSASQRPRTSGTHSRGFEAALFVFLLAASSGLSHSHGYSSIIFRLRFSHVAKENQNIAYHS